MQFRRQNSNQREARPLPEAETCEQLFASVLQGGLNAINGRDGQWIPSYHSYQCVKVSRAELRRQ
jgi:hypothetical protein